MKFIDHGNESTSQQTPNIASKPPEVKIEAWNKSFPNVFRGIMALLTPYSCTSSLHNHGMVKFSLWYFVMAVLAKLYGWILHLIFHEFT